MNLAAAGLPGASRRHLVLVAHGSVDPRHAWALQQLAGRLQGPAPVWVTYLSHHPHNAQWLAGALPAESELDVVPVLLTDGFHNQVDVHRVLSVLAAVGHRPRRCPPVGPDTAVWEAVREQVREVGMRLDGPVVVGVPGSRPRALVALQDSLPAGWCLASLAGEPALGDALRATREWGDPVAVWGGLSGGVLQDRFAQACQQHAVPFVPTQLADSAALADLVRRRQG